jgi:hypothetical protein
LGLFRIRVNAVGKKCLLMDGIACTPTLVVRFSSSLSVEPTLVPSDSLENAGGIFVTLTTMVTLSLKV